MAKKYAIWNKTDDVITPVGEVLTAEQWKERYPVARLSNITVVCSAGEINGGFFGTLGQMVMMYENAGADFSKCVTDEDKLNVIEDFENSQAQVNDNTPSVEERTAAALELLALNTLPDVTE